MLDIQADPAKAIGVLLANQRLTRQLGEAARLHAARERALQATLDRVIASRPVRVVATLGPARARPWVILERDTPLTDTRGRPRRFKTAVAAMAAAARLG